MKYKYLIATTLLAGLSVFSSCKDEFAKINSDPAKVSTTNPRYLFAQCAMSFQPADYSQWFFGFTNMSAWIQTTVLSGGNDIKLNEASGSGCGYQVNNVLKYTNEIKYQISLLSGADKDKYEYIQYLCYPMCVFLSMEDSDIYGSRQYSEAQMVRYGGTLTPKYDTQEELFDLWLEQLDETLAYLNSHDITDELSTQDIIYQGDVKKWAKFANSLKLKIASRLINTDKAHALQIVNEAVQNPAGFVSALEDDFIINKGKTNNNFNNDVKLNAGNKIWIDFMKENNDPRLFYFYMKNDYNSKVIQGFFDQDRTKYIPSYIMENVDYTEVDGKKIFKGWKGQGEPWVRYYGVPSLAGANKMDAYIEYFDYKNEAFYLESKSGQQISYKPTVAWNKFSIKGRYKYTFPDAPDVPPVQTEEYPWYGLYFSAGETNLLLAEFKLLGANLPKSAQEYFTAGVELSVRAYDKVAGLNHLPYYDNGYANDPYDKTIKLTENMITNMLNKEVYKLNGSLTENLEKVYIQQMIHYTMLPMDQFVVSRRSGVPMKNSQLIPYESFDPALGDQYYIPRRFAVGKPTDSDILRDITIAAYEAQGYTYDGEMKDSPITLSKERIWYDKNAPEYGAGPKIN